MATAKDVLKRAKELADSGNTEKAKKFYQAIVDRMPGSAEAQEAEAALQQLEQPAEMNFDDLFDDVSDVTPDMGQNGLPQQPNTWQSAPSDGWQHANYQNGSGYQAQPLSKKEQKKLQKANRPKKPLHKKWWFWVIIAVVVIIIIAAASGGGSDSSSSSKKSSSGTKTTQSQSSSNAQSSSSNTSSSDNSSSSNTSSDANVATMEKYNQIQNNMSYQQVKDIMGFDGTQAGSSSASVAGQTAEAKVYSWQGKALGSNVTVTFYNDKVTSKAQAGLE